MVCVKWLKYCAFLYDYFIKASFLAYANLRVKECVITQNHFKFTYIFWKNICDDKILSIRNTDCI